MEGRLTAQDYQKLNDFAKKGDVFSYWDYLASKGSSYAALARGVVTNETLQGCIANAHTAQSAASAGIPMTPEDNWRLKEYIMRGDLPDRIKHYNAGAADGGFKLSAREVQGYHSKALQNIGLNANGWTANPVVEPLLNNGQDAKADHELEKMQNGGLFEYADLGRRNLVDNPGWVFNSAVNTLACLSPAARDSYRTPDKIDGWVYHPETKDWRFPAPVSEFDNAPDEIADPDRTRELNSRKASRITHFGANAITNDGKPYPVEENNSEVSGTSGSPVLQAPYTPLDDDEKPPAWRVFHSPTNQPDSRQRVAKGNGNTSNQLDQIENALSVMSKSGQTASEGMRAPELDPSQFNTFGGRIFLDSDVNNPLRRGAPRFLGN